MRLTTYLFSLAAVILAGCASSPKETKATDGIAYKRTDRFDKIWIADGFNFSGYDSLFVTPIKADVEPKDDKGRYRLETAQNLLHKDLAHSLEFKHVVPAVVMRETDLQTNSKALKLENSITEFAAGSVAARVMVGFGAGTPHLRLRGQISDMASGKPLLIYDIDETAPILFGHYQSTGSLQTSAALDLVEDISEFLSQVAKNQPIKYK